MNEFVLKFNEKFSFSERFLRKTVGVIGLCAIVIALFFRPDFLLIQFFTVLLTIPSLLEAGKFHRYYITEVVLKERLLTIEYKSYNTAHSISGNLSDYTFYMNSTVIGLYLDVIFKGKRVVRQYSVLNWNKEAFKEVMAMWESAV